jgi:hypothetical protein
MGVRFVPAIWLTRWRSAASAAGTPPGKRVSDATVCAACDGMSISEASARLVARALEMTPVDEGLPRLLGKDSATRSISPSRWPA